MLKNCNDWEPDGWWSSSCCRRSSGWSTTSTILNQETFNNMEVSPTNYLSWESAWEIEANKAAPPMRSGGSLGSSSLELYRRQISGKGNLTGGVWGSRRREGPVDLFGGREKVKVFNILQFSLVGISNCQCLIPTWDKHTRTINVHYFKSSWDLMLESYYV